MIELGRHSYVAPNIQCNGTVRVGNYTSIAAEVAFLCGRGVHHPPAVNPRAVSNWAWDAVPSGDITIGSDVWIGTRAIIFPDVHIGHGAIVGAGAVVRKDVPAYAIVAGVPAKPVRWRFDPITTYHLLKLAWWDWDEQKVLAARPLMGDIQAFLEKYDGTHGS